MPEVNTAETNAGEPVHMTFSVLSLSRRTALKLGLGGLAAGALVQPALAAPLMTFPLRLAYARVSPNGFVQIRSDEQAVWTGMATRLGGLIATLAPLQPGGMLGGGLPQIEGDASCALVARQLANKLGYHQVILYATHDGQRPRETYDNWFSQTFGNLIADMTRDGRATGEAHLLLTDGGLAVASAMADSRPRDPLNLLDGDRNPERETLSRLVSAMELQLQDMAREAYDNSRSIAD